MADQAMIPGALGFGLALRLGQAGVAVSGRATRMLGVWHGSAARQAAEMLSDGVRVVPALHTLAAATLPDELWPAK